MAAKRSISRREFLTQLSAAGPVGLLLITSSPGPTSPGGAELALDQATRATFADHLGSTFRIHPAAGRPCVLELIQATDLPASSDPSLRRPFSLVFRGPKRRRLPQGTHRVEHGQLGTFPLFLVPIGPARDVGHYEAIFG